MIKKWNSLAGLLILICSLSLLAQGSINVTWNAVTQSTTGAAMTVDGYRVYRGTVPGQTTTQVNTTSTLSFLDTMGTQGTTYYYAITAYKGAAESAKSNEASAVFPIQVPAPPTGATAVPIAALQVPCGVTGDTSIHTPPSYTSPLAPPAALGGSIVDPQFGCTITRLTTPTSVASGVAKFAHYSTISSFNADNSKVMIALGSGDRAVVDLSGATVVSPATMPVANSGNLPWSTSEPNAFYYSSGNTIRKGIISGNTVTPTTLRTFTGFSSVIIPDQTDVSDDGTKIWLVGRPATPGAECAGTAILYNISTNTIVSSSLALASCHKIQTFPSGKMLCTDCNGMPLPVYNTNGTLYWNTPYAGSAHADVGIDLQGREILIQPGSNIVAVNSCADGFNSLTVVDINAKAKVNCLINGIPAWHVSYRSRSTNPHGWVLVSTFYSGTCPNGLSCFTLSSNWAAQWGRYTEELILAKIDGSVVYRLAHHRSRSGQYYGAQPHASISRDGKFVAWSSNFAISNTGITEYADVYVIRISA